MSFGKERLPADVHHEPILSIADIRLGASLVIAGFSPDGSTQILETNEQGRVFVRDDFATIGEGSYLAQAALLQREHLGAVQLGEAMYSVYAAKKMSERVTSVGYDTQMTVINPDGIHQDVTGDGFQFLEGCFGRYGPQNVDPKIVSKAESFFGQKTRLTE